MTEQQKCQNREQLPPKPRGTQASMNISEAGIELIKRFEGVKLQAYDDGVGVITIGYGHTKGVRWGDTITQDEAENLLQEDLEQFERCVTDAVDVPLNQNQYDALVSFAFNVGCGALRRSTLLTKLNAGDYQGAADQLLRWNRGGGKVMRGLVLRRQAERELFLSEPFKSPDYEDRIREVEPTPFNDCQVLALSEGDKGPCVQRLQMALNRWSGTRVLTPDGIFGFITQGVVRQFQFQKELTRDGVVGPHTWRALEDYL
ncbi:MAG: glycoside hydrolase family protein [Lamprobacter sp.]|uniref:glycoside hydrolase family protein n=1 Tax=Lamprobacter sp. TaxID=3100796 RepID=UPI002B2598D5|nr:glycoside hydrolase family protein [Lamprobacter sp.]MEA3639925.1 glycoside hydrolase family protein [Lamprobacter sp.]